jgi:hypothetical protein
VFIAASGQKPGRLHESALAVQIDTTLHRSESRVNHGFQQFNPSFNRTLVGAQNLLLKIKTREMFVQKYFQILRT